MRYAGDTPVALRTSERRWKRWCAAHRDLALFAEHWVALMEETGAQQHNRQVRHVAEATLEVTRVEVANLTDAQVREIILALLEAWYLGLSLRNWGKQHSILQSTD